jgi:hypothetical protein
MKKLVAALIFAVFTAIDMYCGDLVLANWDGRVPRSISGAPAWSGTITENFTNPNASGVNTSTNVVRYVRDGATLNSAFSLAFDSMKLYRYPVLSVMVYSPITTILRATIEDVNGQTIQLNRNITVTNTWTEISFDFSRLIKPVKYMAVQFYPNPNSSTNDSYYFDNFVLKGLNSASDSVIITSETCGTTSYNTTTPQNLITKENQVTTFESPNGVWNTNHTIRINNVSIAGTNYTSYGSNYPNLDLSYPTNNDHFIMAWPGRYPENRQNATSHNFDTMQINNINISCFRNFEISYGLFVRSSELSGQAPRSVKPAIAVQVDNGSWINLDTSGLPYPTVADQWKFMRLSALSAPSGNTMNIRFVHNLRIGGTGNKYGQSYIDDIYLSGQPIYVDSIKVIGAGNSHNLAKAGDSLQMSAIVFQTNAYDTAFNWSVVNESGSATIDSGGLVNN